MYSHSMPTDEGVATDAATKLEIRRRAMSKNAWRLLPLLTQARIVDRSGKAIFNLACACVFGAAGLALSTMTGSFIWEIVGISAAVVAVSSARAIFWTIPTRFLTGIAAAGGLAFSNSIGTLSGFAGPIS
ncbi:membrane hypothetical protein [Cupriavidus taiwanensis]|uniref:Uncharacterized protein n=2 Tax=Cupriavidus taiwanensis TaxID=164546 RepID=A0A375EDG2_9BURK|nr:MFS transporter [Cupriavidus taiwanensis]SOZ73155.1 membrane hypothetical protein [Cupriavidus taiwanensis]SOZ73691.1 membrane hypothetical protein [Cupriavidus taiwanensis]SOZ75286.1 membrane hypothetical protein [Cupriavidus taiwanensis]SPA03768.1 membrane hypothetical protein [Cupriavidus taiwanensis]SPA12593.1 membrane hypothetical protein [Cupriavidus taiwanensis]